MDENLVRDDIINELIILEPSIRDYSSKIERVSSDGIPLFTEEIGNFSSSAEKYFVSTSNRELEKKLFQEKRLLNNTRWEFVEKFRNNVVRNLEVLSSILSCIQKDYCDNIKYINISQSYRIGQNNEKMNKRSLCINEASKKELLISIFRRANTLKPFIKLINYQEIAILRNFNIHKIVLNTINELLPIWSLKLDNVLRSEKQTHIDYNHKIAFKIKIPLPPHRAFSKHEGNDVTKAWLQNVSGNYSGDLFATLSFHNIADLQIESEFHDQERNLDIIARIKFTNVATHFIEEDYKLFVKFKYFKPNNNTISTTFKYDTPECIKSELAKQIHGKLQKIHWTMIDKNIFCSLIQQITNFQKDFDQINIKELSTDSISFSINEKYFFGGNCSEEHFAYKFQDILIGYKSQLEISKYLLNDFDVSATLLLRESFLDIWKDSVKIDIYRKYETGENNLFFSRKSNNLLERWIAKLTQKYA